MSEKDYFKSALSDFTFEAANGGAIRHLSDLGYTVKQIMEQLSFPASYKKVQETVWKHMLDTEVILLEEPGSQKASPRTDFVKEYDKYGRTTFRRVNISDGSREPISWRETFFCESSHGKLAHFLAEKSMENQEKNAYISCDFGIWEKERQLNGERLALLNDRQKEYLLGLLWEERTVYHRLDGRMREIISSLFENGFYHGVCYFIETREKIII